MVAKHAYDQHVDGHLKACASLVQICEHFGLCLCAKRVTMCNPHLIEESCAVLRCGVQVLPNKGAGPRALYQVLGGQLPVKSSA